MTFTISLFVAVWLVEGGLVVAAALFRNGHIGHRHVGAHRQVDA